MRRWWNSNESTWFIAGTAIANGIDSLVESSWWFALTFFVLGAVLVYGAIQLRRDLKHWTVTELGDDSLLVGQADKQRYWQIKHLDYPNPKWDPVRD